MVITTTCKSGSLLPLTRTPALTTIFTPPSFCATRFHAGTSGAMTTYGWQDEVDPMWYSCVPPEWDSTACQSLTFSPALQCPYGWTMDKSKSVLGPNLSSITFATCCMSGFTAALMWDGEKCVAPVVNFPLIVLATNPSNGLYASPLATSVSMKTLEKGTIDHRGLIIGWQQSDLTTSGLTPPTSRSTSTGSPPTETAFPAEIEIQPRLSSGSIAGIVIGVVAAFGIGVLALLMFWRRKKKHVQASELDTGPMPELSSPLPVGEPKPLYQPAGTYELGPGTPGALGGVYEMPGR